ncbi:MAG: dihydrolipoyl dehydrogenase [Candidatus Aminicenantes bacterium]|nr:dihydrolipoyl dehydrogenase [Candidatus Aminicenantes bacterium]
MGVKADVVVVGGGPGGYVAAIRAAQLGKRVVLVEREAVGGTCMNWGCIPTKYLLHQTKLLRDIKSSKVLDGPASEVRLDWARVQAEKQRVVDRLVRGVEFLLERHGVEVMKGTGVLRGERLVAVRASGGEERTVEAGRVILATGSRPADLPGLEFDGRRVLSSTDALGLIEIPRSLVVVGAGAIGLEMGTIFSRLGTEVTILEILPGLLPGSDRDLAQRLELLLRRQGLKIQTEMRIENAEVGQEGVVLRGTCLKTKAPFGLRAEKVLLAAGRKPNAESLADGPVVLVLGRGGAVEVDGKLETSVPGVFAIGDLIGGKLLAHKASHEGIAAAEFAAGVTGRFDGRVVPMAVFTDPEFASVGWTENEAREREGRVRVGTFSFQANGRALTIDSPDGLVKVIAGRDDRLLGVHILGPGASDLLAEATLAMSRGLPAAALAETIHIHPTLSEAVMEAAGRAEGRAVHALN